MYTSTLPISCGKYLIAAIISVLCLMLPQAAFAAPATTTSVSKNGSIGLDIHGTNLSEMTLRVKVSFLSGTPNFYTYHNEGQGTNPESSTVAYSDELIAIEDPMFAGRTIKTIQVTAYKDPIGTGTTNLPAINPMLNYGSLVDYAQAGDFDYQLEITGAGLLSTARVVAYTNESPNYTYNFSNMMPGSSLTTLNATTIIITHPHLAGKTINKLEIISATGGVTTLDDLGINVDGVPPYPPASLGAGMIMDYMVSLGDEVGSPLECYSGEWDYDPTSITYQWLRNGIVIAGQTSEFYSIQMADSDRNITCRITATNTFGSSVITTAPYKVERLIPLNQNVPSMYHPTGVYTVGSSMNCEIYAEDWLRPVTTMSYQWLRNGVAISGATGSTYALVQADSNKTLRCRVTAVNSAGSSIAILSNEQLMAEAGTGKLVGPPNLYTSTPEVGHGAFCSPVAYWVYDETDYPLVYKWYRSATPTSSKQEITSGFEDSDYVIQNADEGTYLHCSISVQNSWGIGVPTMSAVPIGPIGATYPYYEEETGWSKIVLASNSSIEVSEDAGRPATVGEALRCEFGGELVNIGKTKIAKFEWYAQEWTPTVPWTPTGPNSGSFNYVLVGTSATYTPPLGNYMKNIRCRGGFANTKATAWSTWDYTNSTVGVRAKTAPTLKANATIYGVGKVGESIHCNPGQYNHTLGTPYGPQVQHLHIRYYTEMLRNGVSMAPMGEGYSEYVVQSSDVGATFTCKGRAQDGALGVTDYGLMSPIVDSVNSILIPAPVTEGPENTSPPTVTGTARMNEYLTCNTGTWSSGVSVWLETRWKRNGVVVEEEDGQTNYLLTLEDYNTNIVCEVMAQQEDEPYLSSNWIASAPRGPIAPTSPTATDGQPDVSPYEGGIGTLFTCSVPHGTFDPDTNVVATTYAYIWYRDVGEGAQLIGGATSSTYTAQAADTSPWGSSLFCRVVATNASGTSTPVDSSSAWLEAVEEPEEPQLPDGSHPMITGNDMYGNIVVGTPLTCNNGWWENNPTSFTYEWSRTSGWPSHATTIIPGAVNSVYTAVDGDRGHTITCRITGHNAAGSAPSPWSEGYGVPGEPSAEDVSVWFSGQSYGHAAVGDTITCNVQPEWPFSYDVFGGGTGSAPVNITYRWLRADPVALEDANWDYEAAPVTVIAGATSATYTTVGADFANYLMCETTGNTAYGTSLPTRGHNAIAVANEDGSPLW